VVEFRSINRKSNPIVHESPFDKLTPIATHFPKKIYKILIFIHLIIFQLLS